MRELLLIIVLLSSVSLVSAVQVNIPGINRDYTILNLTQANNTWNSTIPRIFRDYWTVGWISNDICTSTNGLCNATVNASGGNVSGSGIASSYTYWLAANTLSNSNLYYDIATNRTGFNDFSPDAVLDININDPSDQGLIVQGIAGQTADYFDIRDEVPNIFLKVNSSGNLVLYKSLYVDGNVSVTNGYVYGQPLAGMIGSGIINTDAVGDRGEVNVTCIGLSCVYPAFEVRLVTGTGSSAVYCKIPAGSFTAVNNQHTMRYVDTNCNIQATSIDNYFDVTLTGEGVWDFSNLMCHSGVCELFKGGSIENRRNIKTRIVNYYTDHLKVISGLGFTVGTDRNYTIGIGKYLFVMSKVELTSPLNTTSVNVEYFYHNNATNYTYVDVQGLVLADCDNGTALVTCTGANYRRYYVYLVGWNQTGHTPPELVQTAALLGTTYPSVATCLDTTTNPLVLNLPSYYSEAAVPLYAYCARRTDTTLTAANLIDLRTVKTGSATGSATEVDPVWAVEKIDYQTIADMISRMTAINQTINSIGNWSRDSQYYYNITNLDTRFSNINNSKANYSDLNKYANFTDMTTRMGVMNASMVVTGSNITVNNCVFFMNSTYKICLEDLP